MSSFVYRSSTKLTCECGGTVVLCLVPDLLLSGISFLEAELTNIVPTLDCNGDQVYNYYLTYDETLLVAPTTLLNSFDITGMFCKGCLAAWIEYLVNGIPEHSPAWLLAGNTGTIDGTNFCGTIDNVAFDVRVHNKRARRTIPDTWAANILDGYEGNENEGSGSGVLSGGFVNAENKILSTFSADPGDDSYSNVIAGGDSNVIETSFASIIGGGEGHSITKCQTSAIMGGTTNTIEATVGSYGETNVVGFGSVNKITDCNSGAILAGADNLLENTSSSVICAGSHNQIGDSAFPAQSSTYSGIVTGIYNYVRGAFNAFVGGGSHNEIINAGSVELKVNAILGGQWNQLEGTDASAILGGVGLKLGQKSVGFQGVDSVPNADISYTRTDVSAFSNIGFFGNVDLWLANIDNVARKLKLFEPNVDTDFSSAHYSSLEAQAQAGHLEYKLPAVAGAPGTSLKIQSVVGTVVTLEWA